MVPLPPGVVGRRPALPDDLDFACQVAHEGIGPWLDSAIDPVAFRQGISERLVGAEVIECDGAAIGWMRVLREGERVRLDQIFLAAGVRGAGLGGSIVRQVVAEAGDRSLDLRVVKANPAIRLYRRLGFRVVRDGGAQWHLVRESGMAGPLAVPVVWEPTAAEVQSVARRIGLSGPIESLPRIGIANHVFRCRERIAPAKPHRRGAARLEALLAFLDGEPPSPWSFGWCSASGSPR